MDIKSPVNLAPLVGDALLPYLKRLGIETINDLVYHFPFRYEDKRTISPIETALHGQLVTINGKIKRVWNQRTRSGINITHVEIEDESAWLDILFFNQPYIMQTFRPETEVYASGIMDRNGRSLELKTAEIEFNTGQIPVHTGRIVPIYPETRGLSSKRLRAILIRTLPTLEIADYLPETIRSKNNLIDELTAIKSLHFPEDFDSLEKARYRVGFDELLKAVLKSKIRQRVWKEQGLAAKFNPAVIEDYKLDLPFKLTNAQDRALIEISKDSASDIAMNRLLEGEVGSGKTAVATGLIFQALEAGLNAVFLAPTEVLANQHSESLKILLPKYANQIALHTGSKKHVGSGTRVIVGTHALMYAGIELTDIGAVIIDEQQRFGVTQRALLMAKTKGERVPHVLSMTATPIPRTLALTAYGDLSLSVLDELPVGRQVVVTKVIPEEKRADCLTWLEKQVTEQGDQAFILCPLINESEKVIAKSVITEYEVWQKRFPHLNIGLLHGAMKAKEKERVVSDFRDGQLNILVTTSVIEVGIDMPNATIMIIEGAERYGLASLHQLRGRVGRGVKKSYCFLFVSDGANPLNQRLKALETIHSGFELAELDLKTRGAGDLFGTAQSGLIELKHADLSNSELLKATREAADWIWEEGLDRFPELEESLRDESQIAPN